MFLILGGSGYVGSVFDDYLSKTHNEIKVVCRNELDYSNQSSLVALLKDLRASFVINAAGFTGKPNVDACEAAKYECLMGNAVLPGIIREVCEDLKIPWGPISSGCIYSGRRDDCSAI